MVHIKTSPFAQNSLPSTDWDRTSNKEVDTYGLFKKLTIRSLLRNKHVLVLCCKEQFKDISSKEHFSSSHTSVLSNKATWLRSQKQNWIRLSVKNVTMLVLDSNEAFIQFLSKILKHGVITSSVKQLKWVNLILLFISQTLESDLCNSDNSMVCLKKLLWKLNKWCTEIKAR